MIPAGPPGWHRCRCRAGAEGASGSGPSVLSKRGGENKTGDGPGSRLHGPSTRGDSAVATQQPDGGSRQPATSEPVVEALDETQCLSLIAGGGVGRIGYTGRFGPVVL